MTDAHVLAAFVIAGVLFLALAAGLGLCWWDEARRHDRLAAELAEANRLLDEYESLELVRTHAPTRVYRKSPPARPADRPADRPTWTLERR